MWCKSFTGGRGVDAVIDGVGAATAAGDIKALCVFGRLVSFGRASGPPQLSGDDLQGKSLQWSYFGIFTAWQQPDIWNRGVASLVPLIASGAVDPYITATYPGERAAEAHRLLIRPADAGEVGAAPYGVEVVAQEIGL